MAKHVSNTKYNQIFFKAIFSRLLMPAAFTIKHFMQQNIKRVRQDQIAATKTGCVTDHLIMWIDHQLWTGIWHLESLWQIKTSADKTKTSMMYRRHTRQQPLPSLDHRASQDNWYSSICCAQNRMNWSSWELYSNKEQLREKLMKRTREMRGREHFFNMIYIMFNPLIHDCTIPSNEWS